MYVLKNTRTGQFARYDSEGEHDGRTTDDVAQAREFPEWGAASDYSQNFGSDFEVRDLGDENRLVRMGRAARAELPPC
jgi:hypothetical protein